MNRFEVIKTPILTAKLKQVVKVAYASQEEVDRLSAEIEKRLAEIGKIKIDAEKMKKEIEEAKNLAIIGL